MPSDSTPDNPWAPFEDCLAFKWARYHYIKLQSLEDQIHEGLDLWLAAIIKSKSHGSIPWTSADDLYRTIDSIQAGNAPWKMYKFLYAGPKPTGVVPQWMEEEYELNTRDLLVVAELQLATSEFNGHFNMTPCQEFGPDGKRVWSNLMLGHWAFKEAVRTYSFSEINCLTHNYTQDEIAKDPRTHGAMLVPVIAGSDKTTVSVATGHQEYHPVYASIGNISNTARRVHGNGVIPIAFLPIPKGLLSLSVASIVTHPL